MANVMQVRSSIEVYQSRNIELLLSKALKPLIKSTRVLSCDQNSVGGDVSASV
jgi:hypothetical protein|tara:strand:- start:351 stop:509 length:159 start_codon:yes stop_codon:yes gene_type:complete